MTKKLIISLRERIPVIISIKHKQPLNETHLIVLVGYECTQEGIPIV